MLKDLLFNFFLAAVYSTVVLISFRIFRRGTVRRKKKPNLTETNIFFDGEVTQSEKSAHNIDF